MLVVGILVALLCSSDKILVLGLFFIPDEISFEAMQIQPWTSSLAFRLVLEMSFTS
jgi:hypothetical protein